MRPSKVYKALEGDSSVNGKLIRAIEYTGNGAIRILGSGLEGLSMQIIEKGQVLLYDDTPDVANLEKVDDQAYTNLNQDSLDVTSWEELDDLVKHGYLEEASHDE